MNEWGTLFFIRSRLMRRYMQFTYILFNEITVKFAINYELSVTAELKR